MKKFLQKMFIVPIHILTGLFLFAVMAGSPIVLVFAFSYFISGKEHAFASTNAMVAIMAALWAGQYFYKLGKDFWKDEVL